MKPFFLVWRSGGSAPTVRHDTMESAKAEAGRLALKHPNERFYVLEALGAQIHHSITWESTVRGDITGILSPMQQLYVSGL